jgi:hypothetical protein
MRIPGLPPSTPPSHEPSVLVTLPFGIELLRVFTEVPDVAGLVLGVVVERVFGEHSRVEDLVMHDSTGHTEDLLRAMSDVYVVDFRNAAIVRAFVVQCPPGRKREEGVVDFADEVGRVDVRGRRYRLGARSQSQ